MLILSDIKLVDCLIKLLYIELLCLFHFAYRTSRDAECILTFMPSLAGMFFLHLHPVLYLNKMEVENLRYHDKSTEINIQNYRDIKVQYAIM